jgi:cystathionine gamma-synthase
VANRTRSALGESDRPRRLYCVPAELSAPAGGPTAHEDVELSQAADLIEQLGTCGRELQKAQRDVDQFAAYCVRNQLPVDQPVIARLIDAVRHAKSRIAQERRVLSWQFDAGSPEALSAGEVVLRFGLATIAYVRGSLEWCSASSAQSRIVQFFDLEAQGSQTAGYERHDNRSLRDVERQLLETLDLPADKLAVSATSSGVAAYTLVEAFLLRERLRPDDTVLIAPYIYHEVAEQLTALPHFRVVRAASYDTEDLLTHVVRYRPRCVFLDPLANTAEQRMIDLSDLLPRLRSVVTDRTTVVIDGTMLSGGLPGHLMISDDRVEVLYYESGSKYLQLGLDIAMAGMVAYPIELTETFEKLRRNTGSILYRHGADLIPRHSGALYRRRMRRIGANALRTALLLNNDPRVRDAGQVFHPGLADHPDAEIAQKLPHAGGCVTFLFHDQNRNSRAEFDAVFDCILANARKLGVQLTKGTSFGFSVPRLSAVDASAKDQPPFLRLYVGDRGDQVELLVKAVADALADSTPEALAADGTGVIPAAG